MRRLIAAALAAAVVAGCSSSPDDDVTHDKGLSSLRQLVPKLRDVSVDLIDGSARAKCDSLDSGISMNDVLLAGGLSGLGQRASNGILVYAVYVFCPDYTEQLEAYTGSGGPGF